MQRQEISNRCEEIFLVYFIYHWFLPNQVLPECQGSPAYLDLQCWWWASPTCSPAHPLAVIPRPPSPGITSREYTVVFRGSGFGPPGQEDQRRPLAQLSDIKEKKSRMPGDPAHRKMVLKKVFTQPMKILNFWGLPCQK